MSESKDKLRIEIVNHLAYNLPRHRWLAGLSIAQLSEMTTVSQTSLSGFERGDGTLPSPSTLKLIATHLDCRVEDLLPFYERP